MKLTKASEFAMLLLPAMAHADHPVKAGELSKRTGVPLTYTQIILRKLAQGKVLTSERGRNGGYRLACPPQAIRLIGIVELLEGRSFRTAPTRPRMLQIVNGKLERAVQQALMMTAAELTECYRQELVVTG